MMTVIAIKQRMAMTTTSSMAVNAASVASRRGDGSEMSLVELHMPNCLSWASAIPEAVSGRKNTARPCDGQRIPNLGELRGRGDRSP